uniref:Ovule protein n=1 Tax=Syphacia muris TaxID=451379 RepID=A0A0N5AZB2_9BILA
MCSDKRVCCNSVLTLLPPNVRRFGHCFECCIMFCIRHRTVESVSERDSVLLMLLIYSCLRFDETVLKFPACELMDRIANGFE